TLKKLIDAGELGEVRRFESRFERWKPEQGSASAGGATWKTTSARAEGGGIVYDLGAHLIDQAVQLFGPVTEVYSEIDTRREQVNAEDDAFIALHHGSGVRSQLWMNAVAPGPAPRFHVAGSEAGFTSWGLDPQEPQLLSGMRPGDANLGVVPPSRWGTRWAGLEQQPVPAERGDYSEFYRLLAAAIDGSGPVPVDPADAVYCLEIMERAFTRSDQ
ncbi:MAG: Gfo/Idh/MocA family oxidoreductase, partial [Corynebacterium variabile]|uniref:Gfo/Idh/MocA family protein n=1 Tax=Corynebacterium variabile TaxID=1727 RepID=UPI003BB7B566